MFLKYVCNIFVIFEAPSYNNNYYYYYNRKVY